MFRRARVPLALLLGFSLIAGACGSDDADEAAPAATTAAPVATTAAPAPATTAAPAQEEVATVEDHLGDGSLGTVEVGSGEEIQIRSLNAISGDVAFLGVPNQRGVELAIRDYGSIGGHDVTIGTGLDDLCSADGGQAAAQMIVADEDVVGVIGTSCSGAATAASPLISEAGMVMISGVTWLVRLVRTTTRATTARLTTTCTRVLLLRASRSMCWVSARLLRSMMVTRTRRAWRRLSPMRLRLPVARSPGSRL